MAQYDNNNSGVLFKNDRKESDRQPDYKGNAEVNGVQYWISAWVKESQNGNKFMSLAFSVKEAEKASRPAPAQSADEGDDLPF